MLKEFRHLVQNYRNRGEEEKGKIVPKNKFEMLSSRVMRCRVELRRQETKEMGWVVKCFKYKKEGHKCSECSG